MSAYKFRYTLVSEEADAVTLRWINARSPRHLVIKHGADEEVNRDHWHALVWSEKKLQALRVDFKKANPHVVGAAAYSLAELKDEGRGDPIETYERYMCHGQFAGDAVMVVSAVGTKYTEAWFKDQNTAFWQARKEYKKKVEKRQASGNTVNELVAECEAEGIRDRRGIALKLVRKFTAERRPLNTFYGKSVVNTVWCVLSTGEAELQLVDDMTR